MWWYRHWALAGEESARPAFALTSVLIRRVRSRVSVLLCMYKIFFICRVFSDAFLVPSVIVK